MIIAAVSIYPIPRSFGIKYRQFLRLESRTNQTG